MIAATQFALSLDSVSMNIRPVYPCFVDGHETMQKLLRIALKHFKYCSEVVSRLNFNAERGISSSEQCGKINKATRAPGTSCNSILAAKKMIEVKKEERCHLRDRKRVAGRGALACGTRAPATGLLYTVSSFARPDGYAFACAPTCWTLAPASPATRHNPRRPPLLLADAQTLRRTRN
ncbi:hypothetical protein EVAR_30957_1 [Eumeta japonica]|uniref:Uncharacterized protein n=1 Tax=Eumeta variegata TaxID=151549 RepID=A0A4C1W9W2_EUMVA|nr:hypothetical protein EVAR_30957_1 [Eumeta japonica]